jgi:hypothetical protein
VPVALPSALLPVPARPSWKGLPSSTAEVLGDLEERHAMFVVVRGKNFGRSVSLELHEDSTLGHLLLALRDARELGLAADAAAAGIPLTAAYVERSFWARHAPGDELDRHESRLRKGRREGEAAVWAEGVGAAELGGGLGEVESHLNMRLLGQLGLRRMNEVLIVADLRGARVDYKMTRVQVTPQHGPP